MKRSGPPRRKKRLRASFGSLREWEERTRETARQKAQADGYRRSTPPSLAPERPPKPAPPPVGPLQPDEWRREVWRLGHGRSLLSGQPVRVDASSWVWQAHHPLAKRLLPPGLKYDPRNGIVLLTLEHQRHEHRFVGRDGRTHVIPLERLPRRVLAFVEELDERGVLDESAVELLRRAHPPAEELANPTWRST